MEQEQEEELWRIHFAGCLWHVQNAGERATDAQRRATPINDAAATFEGQRATPLPIDVRVLDRFALN